MSLPINGRIAIIDDKIDQARPLINVLSKNQTPFTYFSGDNDSLPKDGENFNDVRVVFLDINLIDNAVHESKVLKAKLVPVLKRVISTKNFPYVIIYWSRNEDEYKELIEDIFNTDLKDRKPIGFSSANKLSFFNLDGDETQDIDNQVQELFQKVNTLLEKDPVHNYLLSWENLIHTSTDLTLQEIFSSYHQFEDWTNNANSIVNKLGYSYSGKAFKSQSPKDKIKSSFNALSIVLDDTIEHSVNTADIENPQDLSVQGNDVIDNIFSINTKLLINQESDPLEYPGTIIECHSSDKDLLFKNLLNNSINRRHIENLIPDNEKKGQNDNAIKKLVDKNASKCRNLIRSNWKKIYCNVTPLCDFVQGKAEYSRCIHGMLIEEQYTDFIDDKSEAIFISPIFQYEETNYSLILNFRYFFTTNGIKEVELKYLKTLFRTRQQLLAEIQSKLARHISRQGILYLTNR